MNILLGNISNFLRKQIAQSIGVLFETRSVLLILCDKTRAALYINLSLHCLLELNSTWSFTYVSNLNGICYLQRRAERAITNSDYLAHAGPLFSK